MLLRVGPIIIGLFCSIAISIADEDNAENKDEVKSKTTTTELPIILEGVPGWVGHKTNDGKKCLVREVKVRRSIKNLFEESKTDFDDLKNFYGIELPVASKRAPDSISNHDDFVQIMFRIAATKILLMNDIVKSVLQLRFSESNLGNERYIYFDDKLKLPAIFLQTVSYCAVVRAKIEALHHTRRWRELILGLKDGDIIRKSLVSRAKDDLSRFAEEVNKTKAYCDQNKNQFSEALERDLDILRSSYHDSLVENAIGNRKRQIGTNSEDFTDTRLLFEDQDILDRVDQMIVDSNFEEYFPQDLSLICLEPLEGQSVQRKPEGEDSTDEDEAFEEAEEYLEEEGGRRE